MVRIKRKEVRLANRGALKKGFAGARREGVSPADGAGLSPHGQTPHSTAAVPISQHFSAEHSYFYSDGGSWGARPTRGDGTAGGHACRGGEVSCGGITLGQCHDAQGLPWHGHHRWLFGEEKSPFPLRICSGDIARPRVGAAKRASAGQGEGRAMVGWVRRRQMAAGPPSSPAGSQAAAAPRSGARSHGGRAPTSDQAGPHSPLREMPSWIFLRHPVSSATALLLPAPPWPRTFSCQETRWLGGRC